MNPPASYVSADAARGWVLNASAAAVPEAEGEHTGSNGHCCDCSHPQQHRASSGGHADSAAGADAASAHKSDSASSPGVTAPQEESQNGQQQAEGASHTEAAESAQGRQPKQRKAADPSAGATGEPPTLQCTLEDVFLLTAHSENSEPAWQASVGRAVEGMQKAMRDSSAFEPAAHAHYMVRSNAVISSRAFGAVEQCCLRKPCSLTSAAPSKWTPVVTCTLAITYDRVAFPEGRLLSHNA